MKQLRVISLGWGVQSFTLAAMAALGDLEPIDYAIHADTTHEAAGTYSHAEKYTPWLESLGVKIRTVFANRPDVVREDWSNSVLIPAFTQDSAGKPGQIKRQCTHDWKIMPIRKFLRGELKGSLRAGAVCSIQGISVDEWTRQRSSDVAYIVNEYPLCDRRITRADCIRYLQSNGLDVPPKSACTFCPYHNIQKWKDLKNAGGPDWELAIAADENIRHKREKGSGKPGHEVQKGMLLYVHPSRRPLAEGVAKSGAPDGQMEMDIPCDSGMCFV